MAKVKAVAKTAEEKSPDAISTKSKCKMIRCVCKSEFQDARYGAGVRVMNPAPSKKTYRCTVCGQTRDK